MTASGTTSGPQNNGSTNQPPVVSITAPTNGATFTAPANITIRANASDPDGTISKVEFYRGTTLLGSTAKSRYVFVWTGVQAGSYALTAKAYDNAGATTTSTGVNITVNAPVNNPPTVSITSPASGAIFMTPAYITINANASDSDGTVSKVEFFNGATKLGESLAAPYSFAWNNVAAGSYTLSAKATDNLGATATSGVVNITVNSPPTVSITQPVNGATFTAPANITINANASDSDGAITQVEFFQGATSLGVSNTAPYALTWAGVAAGSYSLTARATDNLDSTEKLRSCCTSG